MRIGKGIEQHSVDDGEDRGVRAYSQGQRKDRNDCESPGLKEHAKTVPKILKKWRHGSPPRELSLIKGAFGIPKNTSTNCSGIGTLARFNQELGRTGVSVYGKKFAESDIVLRECEGIGK